MANQAILSADSGVLRGSSVGGAPVARLAALPYNLGALDATLSFASGSRPFVVVCGSSGWGKSHLLRNAAEFARAQGKDVSLVSAVVWLSSSKQASTQPEMLLLDDLHLAASRPKVRRRLLQELSRRVELGMATLCSVGSSEASLRGLLPNLRCWHRVRLPDPSASERATIVLEMCAAFGLLASAEDALLVSNLVEGDGHSLIGALSRLRACGAENLSDLHPIRLAGILHPYTLDSRDLRDLILDSVEGIAKETGCCTDCTRNDVCVYILSRYAELPEDAIASHFMMKPGDVYRTSKRIGAKLNGDESPLRACIDQALQSAAHSLRGQ